MGLHVGKNILDSFPERCYPARIIQLLVDNKRLGEKTGARRPARCDAVLCCRLLAARSHACAPAAVGGPSAHAACPPFPGPPLRVWLLQVRRPSARLAQPRAGPAGGAVAQGEAASQRMGCQWGPLRGPA